MEFGGCKPSRGGVLIRAQIPDMHAHRVLPPLGFRSPNPHAALGRSKGVNSADLTPRPRRSRLTRSGDFDAVYRRGQSASGRHLVLYAFRRDDTPSGHPPRLGVSVSRRVGGAVERNRLKRVLKEQFASSPTTFPRGTDFVVIARSAAFEYIEEQGGTALGERLGSLARKVMGGGGIGRDPGARPGACQAYQRVVSPLLRPRCKYVPSCSEYAVLAVREFGVVRASCSRGGASCGATRRRTAALTTHSTSGCFAGEPIQVPREPARRLPDLPARARST